MMHLPASVRVYLCASACDMRRSFDGLHAIVTQSLEPDAFAGRLFVFANRRRSEPARPPCAARAAMEELKPAAFLGLETSPGNYQAWVALPAGHADKDFARRLRKGAGADDTASGATRVAGSLNFKDKYAPDFPRVQVAYSAPGLMASVGQLESMGLVAAPEKRAPYVHGLAPVERPRTGKWPSYLRCLQNAPPNRDQTGPDISRADFTWCMTAISWGHGIEETAARLMEESAKAGENGEACALLTAQNATAADARNQRRSRA